MHWLTVMMRRTATTKMASVFVSPLVPGQWAAMQVIASAQGRLDAWIDFAEQRHVVGRGRSRV